MLDLAYLQEMHIRIRIATATYFDPLRQLSTIGTAPKLTRLILEDVPEAKPNLSEDYAERMRLAFNTVQADAPALKSLHLGHVTLTRSLLADLWACLPPTLEHLRLGTVHAIFSDWLVRLLNDYGVLPRLKRLDVTQIVASGDSLESDQKQAEWGKVALKSLCRKRGIQLTEDQ
jgi:hypothetical protein